MVDHDNSAEGDREPGADDNVPLEPEGPRRSTWAPAPDARDRPLVETSNATPATESTNDSTSDDSIADALAEDLKHFARPHEEQPLKPDSAWINEAALATEVPRTVGAPTEAPTEEPIKTPRGEPGDSAAAPTAPPIRRSLPMSELTSALSVGTDSVGDSGELLAQLEEQLALREQDAAEFAQWQESMLATGEPEALKQVTLARSEYQDLLTGTGPAGSTPPPHSTPASPVSTPDVPAGNSPAAEAPTAEAISAPPSPEPDVPSTHSFRMDEVLDSDLISAPAPMSPPMTDIPPPPGHIPQPPRHDVSPPIPDLVEPELVTSAGTGGFDFDSLLSGAAPGADVGATVFPFEGQNGEERGEAGRESVVDPDVADNDRVFATNAAYPVTSEGIALVPEPSSAQIAPVYSRQIPTVEGTGAVATAHRELRAPEVFRVEVSSTEPTPEDQRVGRAARMFWLWFAANSSIVSVAFGGVVFSLGMSLRQAIVATLVGVAISFLPLGLGTLAGKWSGQPTMIVSRATFGHLGNTIPSVFALIVRIFWGAVLLWFLAAGSSRILVGAELSGLLGESQVTIIGLALGFLIALVIAYFGYGLIARIQLFLTVISAALIIGLIVITWPAVDIQMALTVGDGPWILVVTGAVLVFSFVGLVWAVSSADLARYQRPESSGTASMLWSTFGATIPAFVLIAYGAVLAASNPIVATGLVETPLDTIALLIPIWYPVPLIAALALSLLSGVIISIYSAGFALHGAGAKLPRSATVVVAGVAVGVVAIGITLTVGNFALVLRDLATSLAVPMAAWAGIFGAEMMIRNRGFNAQSLVRRGGVYPDVNWVNLTMLIVASVAGFGFTTAAIPWLSWQGYFFSLAHVPLMSDLAASDLGVLVALFLGLLTPIVTGIPSIRRQEQPVPVRAQRPVAPSPE